MSHSYDYDLFVIGAGSGGVRAARLTALDGKKVAVRTDRIAVREPPFDEQRKGAFRE